MEGFRKIIFFVLVFFMVEALHSQSITWQRLYNNQNLNDNGIGVCEADSGNFFAVAYSTQAGPNGVDIYVLKLKPNGDTIWTRTYGDHSGIQAFACVSSGDGGCVITGDADSTYFLKIDRNGNVAWEKYYNDVYVILFDIVRTSDNGYVACGRIQNSDRKGYVIKIDSLGNLKWKKIFPSSFNKIFNSILEYQSRYFVAGYANNGSIDPEKGILIKLDLNGEIIWEKTYSLFFDFTNFIKINAQNNRYIISGITSDSSNTYSQTFLAKLDTSGIVYYSKLIYYYDNEYLQEVKILNNGNYVFASDVDSTTGRNARVYIADTLGNILFEKIYFVSEYTLLRSIMLPLPTNDIIFCGTAVTSFNHRDVYVVRTDNTLFAKPLGINNNSNVSEISYELYQNYPNPFNGTTNIRLKIGEKIL